MKWKNVLFTVVLNIFLMLLVTVLIEYNGLSQRMQEACDNIQLAFDTAIESSTATEELFSINNRVDNGNASQTSYSDNGTANTLVWSPSSSGGSWYNGNNYILSWYYWNKGRFPTKAEYDTIESSGFWTPYTIWCWLYGGVPSATSMEDEWKTDIHKGLGQSYTNYPSTCRNTQTKYIYNNLLIGLTLGRSNDDRKPSKEFEAFFNSVGKNINGWYTFKYPDSGTGRFTIVPEYKPTLLKMGFYLDSYKLCTDSIGATGINDDMISTVKLGKKKVGQRYSQSIYFYSPYSLGVTYVPVSVLKPMFLYNLDSIVRLGVASRTGFNPSATSVTDDDFNQSSGCLSTNVYSGIGSAGDPETHKEGGAVVPYVSGNGIINDGQVEYDLRTAQVRVDYFNINVYSNNFYTTASDLYGALPARNIDGSFKSYTGAYGSITTASGDTVMKNIGTLIKANETGTSLGNYISKQGIVNTTDQGKKIDAKCTVRLKLHITYESFILQWMCYKDHAAGSNNHYDIKLYNPSTGSINANSDGVWYEYSKYYAYTR